MADSTVLTGEKGEGSEDKEDEHGKSGRIMGGGASGRRQSGAVPEHNDITPHTLAPEDYNKALSSEPGLYTIGIAVALPRYAGTHVFVRSDFLAPASYVCGCPQVLFTWTPWTPATQHRFSTRTRPGLAREATPLLLRRLPPAPMNLYVFFLATRPCSSGKVR